MDNEPVYCTYLGRELQVGENIVLPMTGVVLAVVNRELRGNTYWYEVVRVFGLEDRRKS